MTHLHCRNMMMPCVFAGLALALAPHTVHPVRYGKYWSINPQTNQTSWAASTHYVFLPGGGNGSLPLVVEYHGGGFTGGSASSRVTAQIESFLSNGIAYASMDYRLVATKYYYGEGADRREEEFIHAGADGRLTLDTTGKVLSDYKVRVGRQEFNTKCSFDAAAGFSDLLDRAPGFGIDVHRIGLTGSSAGGGEIHYLSWVWRGLDANWRRFTPLAMVYTMAQLDYPVQNILDRVWGIWADDVGNETKLDLILRPDENDCAMIVGNPWCASSTGAQTDLCNRSWHDASMARFCGAGGERMGSTTLRELRENQVWPLETEHDRGIARLWNNAENIAAFRARPDVPRSRFWLYVYNPLNGTTGMQVVHNALYARRYAAVAEAAGLEFVSYYPDYAEMRASDRASERLRLHDGTVLNLRESFDWRGAAGVNLSVPASAEEQTLFFCLALGVECSAAPSPPPPAPPLSAECTAEVREDCVVPPAECLVCVHAHARDLIAHGCPQGPGAAKAVIQYCEQQKGGQRALR